MMMRRLALNYLRLGRRTRRKVQRWCSSEACSPEDCVMGRSSGLCPAMLKTSDWKALEKGIQWRD